MPCTLSIREQVYRAVQAEQPCKSREVITLLDGEAGAQQVYGALGHMVLTGRLRRSKAGYYETVQADDEPPALDVTEGEVDAAPRTVTGRPLEELIADLEALDAPAPVDLVIQNPEEKVATCRLLERVLAPHLAERVALIRGDLERIASL